MLRPKLIAYVIVVIAMMIYFTFVIFNRVPIEVDVHRDRGQLFIEVSDELIENVYTLKVANKSNKDLIYTISVNGIDGMKLISDPTISVKAGQLVDYPIQIRASTESLGQRKTDILIKVQANSDASISSEIESRFIAPTL